MKKVLKGLLVGAFLIGMLWLVWKLKWVILGGCTAYVLGVMGCNKIYRKKTGKNMRLYVKMMEGK